MKIKTMIGAAAVALALAGCTVPQGPVQVPQVTCQEDMACWDCSTMGNLLCGPPEPLTCLEQWALNPKGVTESEATAECAEER